MSRAYQRRLIGAAAVGACALTGVFATNGTSQAAGNGLQIDVQLLSFNDFHGNLEPPQGSSGRLVIDHKIDPKTGKPVDVTTDSLTPNPGVGGVEYLATHLQQAREGHKDSLTVAAGDLIGASPLLSAAFHDEPTIEAMNALGLDVSAVGNHEFDEGYKELQRMQDGGCIDDGDGQNNQNSCAAHKFRGANFQYLAANVRYAGTDKTILPAYTIENLHGARIAFIGMTLKDTPSIVTASGVAGLEFTDEVKTANALVPVLRQRGVNAIVVLIHQGGTPGQQTWYGPDGTSWKVNPTYKAACQDNAGLIPEQSPILDIASRLDPAIDMVISGHTHQPYVCSVADPAGQQRLVTSASSFGRLFTETNLTYDLRTRDIVRASVTGSNILVDRNVPKAPAETKIIGTYNELIKPIASKIVGHVTADVTTSPTNAAGESSLGDLIADAQLADKSVVASNPPPQIAFMNPGGIRANLTFGNTKYPNEQPGDITYEEAFTVQPFNNYLVSMDLKGSDITQLLQQQVTGANAGAKKTLQVSNGFSYSMTSNGVVTDAKLGGVPIDPNATYRVVCNSFLSDGGDGFAAFRNGANKYFGGLDIDAFTNYLTAHNPYTPSAPTRISGSL